MRLSTRGRYGARAILDLAINYGKGPILLKDIARRQEISEKYLEHLIAPLRAAGLVKSIRGARGGYSLAKPPSEIRLSQVIQVLEGSMSLVDCVDDIDLCNRARFCVTRDVWRDVGRAINGVLEQMTLEEMVERQRRKKKLPGVVMYQI